MKLTKKECVVMLLAGGQGSRLGDLTKKIAKPSVPFGGKYRIIDFTLSNCVNSGLDTIGVLTQYQPLVLNSYIGDGKSWDLDRMYGGIQILPPYQGMGDSEWYSGTANAIFQNMDYIDQYAPEYVLVLSGDHIYKMDYSLMIKFHKEKDADCTISVIDVPLKEASRFGILNADSEGKIIDFEEKPKKPRSTKASMGIYVFNWQKLKKYLSLDDNNPNSSKDFGKDVIPLMLSSNEKLYSYEFKGYWKDVGTIDSLWEANMDLLGCNGFDLSGDWVIYSRHTEMPPQYLSENSKVRNSIVSEGAVIYGTVENSIIFSGVKIGENAVIRDSVIMADVEIKENSIINNSIIDEMVVIGPKLKIGTPKDLNLGITVIPRESIINSMKEEE
ncbi:glucose-1-phosphate adenylyltransferase [Sedimentibacter hydroxybenzoicus DSM 7310]|uniref:Glucose-1-phosphate adenylyltransferase n=1 Tax=Sedimentibacter hydroxybenzoicus DSM 7310 TaxID=1123245 RepID=A0A974BMN0_SEDHY|nr:glucose-1-phosphate adenylyltransferase [Sedimentibacter hydroxybenzoicus]NYB75978.1 glucose-1-phosphate adenylyltransferase [Sedimentibacter hydroxybenzoicus DSM 7310]